MLLAAAMALFFSTPVAAQGVLDLVSAAPECSVSLPPSHSLEGVNVPVVLLP
jgi:hypothetical protein